MAGGQPTILVVDGAHALRRSMYQPNLRDLSSSTGVPSGGIYGFLNSLKSAVQNMMCNAVVVCWEGGHSQRRIDLLPTYKERAATEGPEERDSHGMTDLEYYIHQMQWVEKVLEFMAVPQLRVKGKEGDDVLFQTTRLLSGHKVVISEDKDFFTIVNKDVSVYRPIKKEYVGIENFRTITGYETPRHFLFAKAILGDGSDNIPGIKGVGEGTVSDILKKLPNEADVTISNVLHQAATFGKSRYNKVVEAGEPHIKRNLELIDISMEDFDNIQLLEIANYLETKRYPNIAMVRKLLGSLEFQEQTTDYLVGRLCPLADFPLGNMVDKNYIARRMMNQTSIVGEV